MADDKTVVLRVTLDEGATEQQLKKLVLDLEATRNAQKALTAERKAGTKSDEEFAAETVKLQQQLKSQQGEYANLTKNLDLYRRAQAGEVGNYQATQAALSLAIRQQHELAGSSGDTTEASQALTAQIAAYREELAATDAKQGAFFRNIGNYPKGSEGLEQLVQQLVTLQEQQKKTVAGTKENEEVTRRIGYVQTAAAQAGAKAGLSYQETTAKVEQYSEALRPAAAALVQLEQAEQAAATSGEATGESMRRIGFQTAAARKALDDTAKSLGKVPEAAEESKEASEGLGGVLLDAAGSSDLLGGAIDKARGAQEFFSKAQAVAKAATLGNASAFQVLKLALISTGLGALVVVLGLIITGLLKSQTATDFLSRKMAALGGFIQPIINLGAELADKLVAAADNPKQAFSDLVDFIEQNLLNRLKAVGQIIEDISNRNFGKLADDFIQLGTGITDATAKAKALVTEMGNAATAAEAIEKESQRIREAERALNVERDQSRAKIEGLKKLSDDTTKTIAQRTAAAKEAAAIENGLVGRQLKLQDDKIRNLRAEQSLKKSLTTEDKNALAELQSERAKVAQESLTLQTELQNKLNGLVSEAVDKRIERRAQELAAEVAVLDQRLAQVQRNSDEELSLLQQKLNKEHDAELNVKNLTVKQKEKADTDYENKSLALTLDFQRRRLLAALQAQTDSMAAQLASQREGSAELLQLQTEQIENQRLAALAALDKNADNTAATDRINAQAAQQRQQLEYADATRLLQEHLDQQRQAVSLAHAQGVTDEQTYQAQLAAVNRAGLAAQAVTNNEYNQSNTANNKAAGEQDIAEAQRVSNAKVAIQDAVFQAGAQFTDLIIDNLGRESAAGQAALAIKKTLAIAEIAINLEKQLSANATYAATLGPLGTLYLVVTDTLAVASAATATANVLKLQRGGIAYGPSHEQGGIQLYRQGRPAGIEIEGGEPVLTRNVTQNPLLLSLASTVNQLAGGRALTANLPTYNMAALGTITTRAAEAYLSQQTGQPIDYDRLAQALAKVNIYTKTQDTVNALERRKYTEAQSNS